MVTGMVTGPVTVTQMMTGATTGPAADRLTMADPVFLWAVACAAAGIALLMWPDRRHPALTAPGHTGRSPRTGPAPRARSVGRLTAARSVAALAAAAAGTRARPPAVPTVTMLAVGAGSVAALAGLSVPLPWTLAGSLAVLTALRLVRRARADARETAALREAAAALRALVRELQAGTRPGEAARRVAGSAPPRVAAMLETLAGNATRAGAGGLAGGARRDGTVADVAPGAAPTGSGPTGSGPTRSRPAGNRTNGGGAVSRSSRALPHGPRDSSDIAARLRAAWTVAQRTGVPLADVISAIAADVAARSAARQARAAQVAGPAVSGYVLAVLPLAGLLLGAGMGSDPLAVLGTGAVGGGLLVVGVGLCCGGLVWADRIVRGRA